ncbi:MAG: DUF2953 domain-containing protein [Christensenellaceae bacterium]|nr:DUF2953 domain-containing protein [Christensenellaceae bacterium]
MRIFYWKIPVKRLALIVKLRAGAIPYVYLENRKLCTRIFPKKNRKNHRRIPLIHAVLWSYRTEKLNIDIMIGTDDAALTAYSVGIMRTAICLLLPKLRLRDAQKAEIAVRPDFEKRCFSAKGECIISARPADIIRKAIIRKADNNHAPD